jgi:hypothetical protein
MNKIRDIILSITSISVIQAIDIMQLATILQIVLQLAIAVITIYKLLKSKDRHPKNPYKTKD